MSEDFEDSYHIWQRGLFYRYPYSMAQKGNMTTYTFYTDMKVGGTGGDHQLSADVKKLTNAPIDDSEIVDAFIESLSKKIWLDVVSGSTEYVECLKTLPKGFYTERTVEAILHHVISSTSYALTHTKNLTEQAKQKLTIRSDTACWDLMDYAHEQNHNIRKGTGRDHLGE